MLIRREALDGIADGSVTLQFRRWQRPSVKAGGTLLTVVGQLAVDAVDRVDPAKITGADAKRAGFISLAALREELAKRDAGEVYRIRLRWLGADPREELRATVPTGDELEALVARVRAFDQRSKSGPWAVLAMAAIAKHPATRAPDLAASLGMETVDFKAKVRRLKGLGLTESLKVGYRLSPRGEAVQEQLSAR